MFPCVMEKPAFPTRDAQIYKKNLFVLNGRAVSFVRIKVCKKRRFQVIEKVIPKF